MGVTPIDMSFLAAQRPDASKVAGDEFLKIQQDQLAVLNQHNIEEDHYSTKEIETSEDLEIKEDQEKEEEQKQSNQSKRDPTANEDEDARTSENIEMVAYDDPDVGHAGDWSG
jgi:hypothetical protein